jgi:hypothetical protein
MIEAKPLCRPSRRQSHPQPPSPQTTHTRQFGLDSSPPSPGKPLLVCPFVLACDELAGLVALPPASPQLDIVAIAYYVLAHKKSLSDQSERVSSVGFPSPVPWSTHPRVACGFRWAARLLAVR